MRWKFPYKYDSQKVVVCRRREIRSISIPGIKQRWKKTSLKKRSVSEDKGASTVVEEN